MGFFPWQDFVLVCVMNGTRNLLVVYLTVRMGVTCVVLCVHSIVGRTVGVRFLSVAVGRFHFFPLVIDLKRH